MTAITKLRNTKQMQGYPLPGVMSYPVAAAEVLYQGTLCMLKAGFLYDGATTTGAQGVGMVDPNQPDIDNSAGADGDENADVIPGVFNWGNSSSADLIAQDDVGKLCYIVDNQTVALTDGTASRSIAGTIVGVDASGVWVYSNLAAPVDATALAAEIAARLAFQSDLASTANAKGASLVGVEDAGGIITATTVEAALAEIMKKANAALGNPVSIPVVLVKHANASIAARFTPGFAGKIRKITAYVIDPVTTAAKLATFTPAIAGTPTTGGALALTSANCTPVGAKVDGSAITAANAFSAAQEITLVASSVTAFVEGQVVALLFLDPA